MMGVLLRLKFPPMPLEDVTAADAALLMMLCRARALLPRRGERDEASPLKKILIWRKDQSGGRIASAKPVGNLGQR